MSERYSAVDFYDKMDHEGGWEYFIIDYGVSEDEVPEKVWDAIESFTLAYHTMVNAVQDWKIEESNGNN